MPSPSPLGEVDSIVPTNNSVLMVITGLSRGGAETQVVRLAVGLRNKGWRVSLLTLNQDCDFKEELAEAGIPVHPLRLSGALSGLRRIPDIAGVLRQARPDIIVSFLYHANVLSRILGLLSGVPVVSSIRNEYFGGALRDCIESITQSLSSAIVVNSHIATKKLIERGVIREDRAATITNGLSTAPFNDRSECSMEIRAALGIPKSAFTWVNIARIEPQKDHSTLLRAFEQVWRINSQSHLMVVGKGIGLQALRESAARSSFRNHIHILGRRNDIPALLASANAFVLSSRWEGLPNALMEAMAAGLPVASTDVGGVAELIRGPQQGLLVPPNNPASLARAMLTIQSWPGERFVEAARASRQIIAREYSTKNYIESWEHLCLSILANNKEYFLHATPHMRDQE